jgi:hypothetical protein
LLQFRLETREQAQTSRRRPANPARILSLYSRDFLALCLTIVSPSVT